MAKQILDKQTLNGGKSMILSVVNPIYDSIFKFLMEDERVAKTVLSALLKKEVVSVEMRRHEHTNTTRNDISMFRIDFAARVKDDDGNVKLILIELQKTWVETETLRFRQYLAAQYNAKENMQETKKGERTYAIPMISVYLLGHRVGNFLDPVVYVGHSAKDYDGNVIEDGEKDPFVSSLVHDSIIVQLPLLRGKINNHLEMVLSVFDQHFRDKENPQVINLDEQKYEEDQDMQYILHRLTAATVNAELRQEMNVEDEYYSAIEKRDTELMEQKRLLDEKDSQIAANKKQLAVSEQQIAEQSKQLAVSEQQIAEQSKQLAVSEQQIAERDNRLGTLIKMMLKEGKDKDEIATLLQMPESEITKLLEK